MNALQTTTLRRPVRDEIARRILRGDLPPGRRINETELAHQLGVSQTPVREALLGLEAEGLARYEERRGFVAPPLDRDEAAELYALIGNLERFALSTAAPAPTARLRALARLNERIAGAGPGDPARVLELDGQWHALLLEGCPNRRLHAVLAQLKRAVYRYEYAYMLRTGMGRSSAAQHDEILDALRAGEVDRAGTLLEENWLAGVGPLAAWLQGGGASSVAETRRG